MNSNWAFLICSSEVFLLAVYFPTVWSICISCASFLSVLNLLKSAIGKLSPRIQRYRPPCPPVCVRLLLLSGFLQLFRVLDGIIRLVCLLFPQLRNDCCLRVIVRILYEDLVDFTGVSMSLAGIVRWFARLLFESPDCCFRDS